jgi:trehalose 6-phosphate phosphatase
MIGDDVPDESAFAAAVRNRGLALRVAGEHFAREAADFESPFYVRSWLAAIAARLDA